MLNIGYYPRVKRAISRHNYGSTDNFTNVIANERHSFYFLDFFLSYSQKQTHFYGEANINFQSSQNIGECQVKRKYSDPHMWETHTGCAYTSLRSDLYSLIFPCCGTQCDLYEKNDYSALYPTFADTDDIVIIIDYIMTISCSQEQNSSLPQIVQYPHIVTFFAFDS